MMGMKLMAVICRYINKTYVIECAGLNESSIQFNKGRNAMKIENKEQRILPDLKSSA